MWRNESEEFHTIQWHDIKFLILCLVKLQTPIKKIVVLLSDDVDNTGNVSFHLSWPKAKTSSTAWHH